MICKKAIVARYLLENNKKSGEQFPLLIKFIDAKEDLSIQLHPNDELAKKRHNSFGKTEMWYVMQADKETNLIVGFQKDIDKETYLKHLEDKSLTKILNFDKVKEGENKGKRMKNGWKNSGLPWTYSMDRDLMYIDK